MGFFDWFCFVPRKIVPTQPPAAHDKSFSSTSSPASSAMDLTAQDADNRPSTCFTCTRLNSSTFRIVEADKYGEFPFIYAKVYDTVIVLVDTGCGGAAKAPAKLTSLREFIENYPVEDNDSKPLNPGGSRSYAVVCTHCHYDHIGGIAQFTDAPKSSIWASDYDKGFIEDDLPTSSLCRFVGMETPHYKVTDWAADAQRIVSAGKDLGLTIYHTPGHTPDELAVWDQQERVLYVGDTLYEWAPILFSLSGNLDDYAATLRKLRRLVDGWNEGSTEDDRVLLACGHCTHKTPAADFLYEVDSFFDKIRRGLVSPVDKGTTPGRNIPLVGFYREDGWFSFVGPKELFDTWRQGAGALAV